MADDLRKAAEQLERAALGLIDLPELFRVRLAQQQAQRAVEAMATPHAEAALGLRAQAQARQAEMEAQARLAQQRAQAAFAASPLGQAQAQRQAQQRQEIDVLQLRSETARMAAEARHYATPQGQAQLEAQRQAQRENLQARQALAQARGEGPGVADRFGEALGMASRGLGAFRAALSTAEGVLMTFGAKASPAHAQTMQGSIDLLMSRVGGYLLPVMEQTARYAQAVYRNLPDPNSRQGRMISEAFDLRGLGITPGMTGMDDPKQLLRSLAGLPQAQLSTAEGYEDRLQLAGLNYDELQTEQLREIVRNLATIIGHLEQNQPSPDRDIVVPFR